MSSSAWCRQAVSVFFRKINPRNHCTIIGGISPGYFQYNSTMGGDDDRGTDNSAREKPPRKKDHLELTAEQQREPGTHAVTVTEIRDISPTVKKLVLQTNVRPVPIQFKAGQWIDMFIPNVSVVGGYTITSSPLHLQRTGQLELAVKYSDWPPAVWVHTQCKVGSEVTLRTGGDFFFDSTTIGDTDRVLLLAGGVGINPLASIVNQIQEEMRTQKSLKRKLRTSLLFSAKLESELLFKERFESYAETDKDFKCTFFLTGTGEPIPSSSTGPNTQTKAGRIGLVDIREALEEDLDVREVEDRDKLQVYICGPPPMIKDLEQSLKELNITKNVFFETWWQ